jgi:hypothetical protein
MELFTWIGILLCLTQSAMFSGLNLAFFSLSRLTLESEAAMGNKVAAKVLAFRRNSNLLLTTILWGNVGINVLLTLLSNSVMIGLSAFLFSTIAITLLGEILPQAYFSRRALRVASLFAPIMKFYQMLLYPVAKPSAWVLDQWLGKERIEFMHEKQLTELISQHIRSVDANIDRVEGRGALNFLDIDDIPISLEGEKVHPDSIIRLPVKNGLPLLPDTDHKQKNGFIKMVNASGKKWVILADLNGNPKMLLDADAFIRNALLEENTEDQYIFCHQPIIITDSKKPLGDVIIDLKYGMDPSSDTAIDNDIVLLWTEDTKRIITGADILGRLLHGIT